MGEKNNVAVSNNNQSLQQYFDTEISKMDEALPKNFNKQKFIYNSLALLRDFKANQKVDIVAKYGAKETLHGLIKGAILNLDFYNKECYLIPYGDHLNFQIDYKGAKKLAKQYSSKKINEISAEIVRMGDKFEKNIINGKTTFKFEPKPFNQSEILGAFAYVVYEDGDTLVDTMPLAELEKTRALSKQANKGAWANFTTEMYKKTVLHRLCKVIDLNFDNPEQRNLYEKDVEIETEPLNIAKNEINENENTINFTEIKTAEENNNNASDRPADAVPKMFDNED